MASLLVLLFLSILILRAAVEGRGVIEAYLVIKDTAQFEYFGEPEEEELLDSNVSDPGVIKWIQVNDTNSEDDTRIQIPSAIGRHRFQIGTALCILWLIVGLKIIFCCTIVLRHEQKPAIIRHNNFRIQQLGTTGNVRFRREEGLVHLPEEEEVEEIQENPRKVTRSSVKRQEGQESTTPPPPYSSLGISL